MTITELAELFNKNDSEYNLFVKIKEKKSPRSDVHAFLLLETLAPGKDKLIVSAEHDEIYLSVDLEELCSSRITEEHIIDLIRCGIMLDETQSALKMLT